MAVQVHRAAAGTAASVPVTYAPTADPVDAYVLAPDALNAEAPKAGDDGGTRLPPSAGPISHMAVDLAIGQVLLDGRQVPLSAVEFKLLRYLVMNCSRAIGRSELQQFLESFETPGASVRAIDVYVGRVRRKLGNARHAVSTVRGRGYQFIPGPCASVRGSAEYCI